MSKETASSDSSTNNVPEEEVLLRTWKSCRIAGKSENFEELLDLASIGTNQSNKSKLANLVKEFFLALFYGYKGYALWKQNRYYRAIPLLRESQRIRLDLQHSVKNELQFMSEKQKQIFFREGVELDKALQACYQSPEYADGSQEQDMAKPIKYPRTVHLFDSGGTATTKDDLVLEDLCSIISELCQENVKTIVEEKIDGANIGISQSISTGEILVQNRSHYISQGDHAQYTRIPEWIAVHQEQLKKVLQGGNRILYGEWVVARHSIPYERLPGWFIAFDLYDKEEKQFISRRQFHSIMKTIQIPVVPVIAVKQFSKLPGMNVLNPQSTATVLRKELLSLLETKSKFRKDEGFVEGVILRVDDPTSEWLHMKHKIVRPDFVGGCNDGHWSSRPIKKQIVDYEFSETYLASCYQFADS